MIETTVIHDPKNTFKIESLYAFISEDETGEGLCGAPMLGMGSMPLIAADEARLESLRSIAKQLAKMTKKKIKLIKLTSRVDLEEIS